MSTTQPSPDLNHPAHPPADDAQQAGDAQYYRQILHELIDIGASLARTLQATDATANSANSDPTIAFDRIARAIRRTIVLARYIAEPPPERASQPGHRTAARKRIIRSVEDVIQREAGIHGEAESLHAELLDRLDSPDLDDDIAGRPIADIIADICRDLGLSAIPGTHPWQRRTPDDIAILCARAASPRPPEPPPPTAVHPVPPSPWPGSGPPLNLAEPPAEPATPHPA
jgi:hypothetical protein